MVGEAGPSDGRPLFSRYQGGERFGKAQERSLSMRDNASLTGKECRGPRAAGSVQAQSVSAGCEGDVEEHRLCWRAGRKSSVPLNHQRRRQGAAVEKAGCPPFLQVYQGDRRQRGTACSSSRAVPKGQNRVSAQSEALRRPIFFEAEMEMERRARRSRPARRGVAPGGQGGCRGM